MTDAFKTPCRDPLCSEKVKGAYCEEHGGQRASREAELDERPSARERGYDADWRRVRNKKLAIDPLCERHALLGETVAADMVHHIVPLSKGGDRLAMENLQSLCYSCHSQVHESV